MRYRLPFPALISVLALLTFAKGHAWAEELPEPRGLGGHAEFYLPGDPDEPVHLYFAEVPLDLKSPNFNPEEYRENILNIYEDFALQESTSTAQRLGEPDPSRLRSITMKKLFGKTLHDADWEIRMDNLNRIQGGLGEELVTVEPTPEQRLEKFKMFFTEFSVNEEDFDPVVQRNLAALRRAIENGDEEFLYEKLTFREKIQSTRKFLKDISRPSTDPEVAKNLTKVAGVYVDRGEIANGLVFASYRGFVTGNVMLMKGVRPEIAASVTMFQMLLTFAHATFGRHYSAMFNINPEFPGFRFNSRWVKLRKDFYYIWVGEITQFLLGGMSWSHLAGKQLRILFQNQLFGTIDHHWGAQPRDMILKGKAKPTKWFNRIGYVLITPWTTMETLEAFKGTLLNIRLGGYEVYGIRWTTVGVAGMYLGLKTVLTRMPRRFDRFSEWLEQGEQRALAWVMKTRDLVIGRCQRMLGRRAETEFISDPDQTGGPTSTARQNRPNPKDQF